MEELKRSGERGRNKERDMEGDVAAEVWVVAHCLLNPSTRVKGLRPVEFHLRPDGRGPIIQLPCPEALYMGLDRWAVTRNQLDVPEFRRFCRSLIPHYADLLEMLAKKGFKIRIVGVAGSPSCGVRTTSTGYEGGRVRESEHSHLSGRGVFMEELLAELERRGIGCNCEEVGVKNLYGSSTMADPADPADPSEN